MASLRIPSNQTTSKGIAYSTKKKPIEVAPATKLPDDLQASGFDVQKFRSDATAVTSFAILRQNGKWDYYTSLGCHGTMAYATNATDKIVMTAAWVNASGDVSKSREYYDFLFDTEESPWRTLFQGRKIYKALFSDKRLAAVGLSVDKDLRFGPLMNLLVATRTPWERPWVVNSWHRLVHEFKLSRVEALYLSAHMFEASGVIHTSAGYSHWAYDAMSENASFHFSNFRDSKFTDTNKNMYGSRGYGGINVTWNTGKPTGFVAKMCNANVYDGVFIKHWHRINGSAARYINRMQPPKDMASMVKKFKEVMNDAGK